MILISSWKQGSFRGKGDINWSTKPLAFIWSVWKERNARIFKESFVWWKKFLRSLRRGLLDDMICKNFKGILLMILLGVGIIHQWKRRNQKYRDGDDLQKGG